MPTAPLKSTKRTYWHDSRAPRYSLTFALPLLALYEGLAAALSVPGGGVRNGADVLLKSLFVAAFGWRGPIVFGALLLVTLIALIVRDRRRTNAPLRGATFAVMFAESAVLASLFGVVVGLLTAQLVAPLQRLAAGPFEGMGFPTALMISLGAGLYEELLFRVILVTALVWGAKHLLGWGPVTSALFAIVTGALVFSAFHYVGPFGDPLDLGSFVFRAIAGVAFSALYVVRGFGITAWTHALYDVMLLVVRG